MNTFTVSANGTVFGQFQGADAQAARDACAQDAGYNSEADMANQLGQPSELVAEKSVARAADRRVNDTGVAALKRWIEATSLPDHEHTDQRNLEAWCQEAEESMGNGNPPMVEMSALHTLSGSPETFVIPANGIYEVELDD